jgi:hypothetical protein
VHGIGERGGFGGALLLILLVLLLELTFQVVEDKQACVRNEAICRNAVV